MKKYIAMLISLFQTIVSNSRFNRQKSFAPANLRLMIFLCGLFFLLAPQISMRAQSYTQTISPYDKGYYYQKNSSGGSHTSSNESYYVGTNKVSCGFPCGYDYYRYRNFFTFDFSGLSTNKTITNAFLRIQNPGNFGTVATYTVWDVSTPISTLRAGGTGLSGIFDDLGSGTSYTSVTPSSSATNPIITDNFNAAGLSAISANRGGSMAFGGSYAEGTSDAFLFNYVNGQSYGAELVLTIDPCNGNPISVNPATVQTATVGLPYSQNLTASGGVGSGYYFSGSGGSSPVSLNSNGVLSGTPTTAGTYNFTVTAQDSNNCYNSVPKSYSLVVNPANLSISDATVSEPATGTVTATFLVSLGASNQTVTVNYATANGTAIAGQDYTATNGTLTFAPGETTKAINVIVNSDMLSEVTETFTVNLSNAVNAPISDAQGIGTIRQTLSGNGKIAFNSTRDGNLEIYSMNSDGSNQTRLTNNLANDELPIWSPDGTKLSFASSRNGTVQIFKMDADGSNQTQLTNNSAFDYYPSWSPNGSKIVFNSSRDGNNEIYVMNADGTGQTNLTNNPGQDEEAKFSPDGSKIVFTSRRDAGNYEIYTMNADGSNQTRLTNTSALEEFASWSPDGSKIAFYTDRDGNNEIYVMNANGSNQTRLTNNSVDDLFPTWSPDGSKITFTTNETGTNQIYVMNTDGTNRIRLSNNGAIDYFSSWQAVAANVGTLQFSQATFGTNENYGTVAITVTRTGGSDGTVAVNYATSDGTATAGTDYSATGGTVVFNPGETSKTFTVSLIDDAIYEGGETFNLTLSSPTGGTTLGAQTTALVNIYDNESPPQLSVNGVTVNEPLSGTTTANFTVTLTGATTVAATVNYATLNDTAIAPGDYLATNGTLTFAVGETSKNIAVTVNSDNLTEGLENFYVILSGATNAQISYNGTGTIRQQYGTGGKILFSSNRDGNYEIYTMNADGTNQTRITNNAADDVWARWSPDGSKITFASDRDGNSEVYVMNADGSNVVRLTTNAANDSRPSWSPYGTSIVFTSNRDGDNEIYTMNATNGSSLIQYTANSFDDDFASWSSDGAIAIHSNRDGNSEIYRLSSTRLTNNATADYSPNYSPDSTKIAFEANRDGNSEVYTMNADGTAQTNISNDASVDGYPSWSPEGSKIVFNSNRNGNREIYVMNPDGTTQTRLTNNAADDTYPSWQPVAAGALLSINDVTVNEPLSGTTTANFTVTRSQSLTGITTVNYTTADNTAIASGDYLATNGTLTFAVGETSKNIAVTVNSDNITEALETFRINLSGATNATYLNTFGVGTIRQQYSNGKIAFNSRRDGNLEVYSMNSDGSGQTRITNNAASDELPIWSPDGSKIVFGSSRDGNLDIYSMNADGTNQTRLTTNAANDYYPAWSPDGSKISFNSSRDGNSEIYVMNADGSNQINITNNAGHDEESKWSPDGSKIVFTSRRDAGNYEVYVMNADGSNQTRLTNTSALEEFPSWSPDGSKIAFYTDRDGNSEIYLMNPDGSGQTRITNNAAADYFPTWSPDGTKITFSTNRDGNLEVYVMNPDGSNQTRLTNVALDDYFSSWQPVSLAPASVQFSGATYAVAENVATATITVTRTNGNGTASIDYATSNGTATAGQDYAATSGTLTFNSGETSKTFTVSITDDTLAEGDETINLALTNPVNMLLGTPNTAVLTITDNEPPLPNLTINDATISEPYNGTAAAVFTVSLSASSASAVTVNFATADNSATSPADFTAANGTVTFNIGETSKTVTVNVKADALAESTETFFVNLSGANGATIADAQGIGTIQNLSGFRAWGGNIFGQLGDSSNSTQSLPIVVAGLGDIVQISGANHTLALKTDGTVLAWGRNDNGQLGNGSTTNSNTPVAVIGLTNIVAVSAGGSHSLALKSDGTVWAWGSNSGGQTGLGTYAGNTLTPTQISGFTNVAAIEASELSHSIALKTDGTVWTWGDNSTLQLGTNAVSLSNTPLQVSGLSGAIAVGAGVNFSFALKNDGTVHVWGSNSSGQFGNGTISSGSHIPTAANITNVTNIAAGNLHAAVLKTDGTVWAWGSGGSGQIGNSGAASNNPSPLQTTISNVTEIKVSGNNNFARKKDGSIWAWGRNFNGEFGNGTINAASPPYILVPVQTSVGTGNAVFGIGLSSGFVANPIVTTPIGANVKTNLGDAALTFSNVTGAGNTMITAIDAATTGLNPGSYTLKSDVQGYNLQTNATFTGNIEVCLKVPMVYSQASFFALRLMHGEGGNLIDRTSTTNYAKREVCGIVTSLSPFVLGLAPTAASVSVSGRVTAANGNGIRNVVVALVDSNGQTRMAKTSSFGYYNFDEVAIGTATISVISKRFTFANPTQVISVTDSVADLDFTALE